MRLASSVFLSGLVAVASAHFQLSFPPPRGPFNQNNEPTFCDGYAPGTNVTRTDFPLEGGFISLNSEHPQWVLGVQLSTLQVPTSFQNFSGVVPFFQVNGEGSYCFPVDFAASNVTGLQDGQNVTIQLTFNGGDGELFQCADLTLKSGLTLTNTSSCTNATGDSVSTINNLTFPSASSGSSSAPSPSQGTPSSAGVALTVSVAASVVAFAGALFAGL
ncbi:hypothetical protein BC835DRAFT_1417630 [Cytidiella melzeri]|nr:hypothetical protein BC835DRAFT_1417630 [Cytidiella melzeri]